MTNSLLRPLGIASAISAFLQGLTWSVLTLLGILIYTETWRPQSEYMSNLSIAIINLFLTDYPEGLSFIWKTTMNGYTMMVFISLYFGLSIIWMILSLCKLWVLMQKKMEYVSCTLGVWATFTGILSILDIVTVALLAIDLGKITDYYQKYYPNVRYEAVAAAGLMMGIAGRGFVLLLANIIFSIIFGIWSINTERPDNKTNSLPTNNEFINAYEPQNPPAWLRSNGSTNGDFGRQFSNPGFEDDSLQRASPFKRNQYDQPNYQNQPDNYAKIGRNNAKVPQYQTPPQPRGPHIPAPDYSPPSLRKHPKSVLKSRSHY